MSKSQAVPLAVILKNNMVLLLCRKIAQESLLGVELDLYGSETLEDTELVVQTVSNKTEKSIGRSD